MSFKEQQKILDELKKFEHKISSSDRELYKMFVKRQKDEEEFDTISMSKLRNLHSKYVSYKSKTDLNSLFKNKNSD